MIATDLADEIAERADEIVAQQHAAADAWHRFIARTVHDATKLLGEMPLGCCVGGYDSKDILVSMLDWMNIREPDANDRLEALDIATYELG